MHLPRLMPAVALALAVSGCGATDSETAQSTAAIASSGPCPTEPTALRGEGLAAFTAAFERLGREYAGVCPGGSVTYRGTGTTDGVRSFLDGNVPIAATTHELSDEQQVQTERRCSTGRPLLVPFAGKAITVPYNLPGVPDLRLSPTTLAAIVDGDVTRWNDPAVAADNPGVQLPDTAITFLRSGVQTVERIVTEYLAGTLPTGSPTPAPSNFPQDAGRVVDGGTLVEAIAAKEGSVGFQIADGRQAAGVELASLGVENEFVEPTIDSVRRRLESFVPASGENPVVVPTYGNPPADAYPLVVVGHALTCETGLTGAEAVAAKGLIELSLSEAGQQALTDAGYAALPGSILGAARGRLAAMTTE